MRKNEEKRKLLHVSSKESTLEEIAEESNPNLKADSLSISESAFGSRVSMNEEWKKILDVLVRFRQDVKSEVQNLNNKMIDLDQKLFLIFDKMASQTNEHRNLYPLSISELSTKGSKRQGTPPYVTPLPNVPNNTTVNSAQSSQFFDIDKTNEQNKTFHAGES